MYTGKRETVLVQTIRLRHNKPFEDERFRYSTVGLERILKRIEDDIYSSPFIRLKEYHVSEETKRLQIIGDLKKQIEEIQRELKSKKADLKEWQEYIPCELTKEYIKQIAEDERRKTKEKSK